MNSLRLPLVAKMVRSWVMLYTTGLRPLERRARMEEIDSDLWEQSRDAELLSDSSISTSFNIAGRFILGIPMDLTWRFSCIGLERYAAALGVRSLQTAGGQAIRLFFRSYLVVGTLTAAAALLLLVGSWTVIRDQTSVGDRVDTSAIGLSDVQPQSESSGPSLVELSSIVPYMAVKARTQQGDTVTKLHDDRVLVVGDFSSPDDWNGAQVFDPRKEKWKSTAYLVDKRRWHTSTLLLDGRVLVTGGRDNTGEILHTVEVFDPEDNTWTSTSVMNYGRAFHAAALLHDGRVMVVGGFANGLKTLGSAEVYDPDTQTWTLIEKLGEPRFFLTTSVLHDGRVLVAGGTNNTTGSTGAHKTSEVYDPVTGSWAPAGELAINRIGHTATVLRDGRVLTVGGGGLNATLVQAEIFDPALNSWSSAGIMTLARAGHSAAIMSDGRVIVAGGWSDLGSASHVAEIYDPRVGTWFAMAVTP